VKSRLHRVWNVLAGTPKPKTRIASGSSKQTYYNDIVRNKERLQKFKNVYEQGGLVSETLDCYPLYMLSNGWRLEGDEHNVKRVQNFIDSIDFETILKQGILDAVNYGDAFQEKVFSRGGEFQSIELRDSTTFDILYNPDLSGYVEGYKQSIINDGKEYTTELPPDKIINLRLLGLAGSPHGLSIIGRAYDEIIRDTKTAESTAVAIQRHGYKKYHIRVGLEGEDIPQAVMEKVDTEFQELETKNDFVTSRDVEIANIDEGGLDKVDTYSDISLTRLAAGLGVPAELSGTRKLPGNVKVDTRMDMFFRKLKLYQRIVSRCYERNVFDYITSAPGKVKLIFNDISPHDEAAKAEWIAKIMSWIAKIMSATPIDPFIVLPREYIQEQFDIDPDAYDEEDPLIPEVPEEVDDETEQIDQTEDDAAELKESPFDPLTSAEQKSAKKLFGADCGFSVAKDKDGFLIYTHRSRSKSYPKLEDIPISVQKFIESTG